MVTACPQKDGSVSNSTYHVSPVVNTTSQIASRFAPKRNPSNTLPSLNTKHAFCIVSSPLSPQDDSKHTVYPTASNSITFNTAFYHLLRYLQRRGSKYFSRSCPKSDISYSPSRKCPIIMIRCEPTPVGVQVTRVICFPVPLSIPI